MTLIVRVTYVYKTSIFRRVSFFMSAAFKTLFRVVYLVGILSHHTIITLLFSQETELINWHLHIIQIKRREMNSLLL